MGLLESIEQIDRVGRESGQAEADHHDPADAAAPPEPTQLEREGDQVASQKAKDGDMKHLFIIAWPRAKRLAARRSRVQLEAAEQEDWGLGIGGEHMLLRKE